jgi:hypothetical protein
MGNCQKLYSWKRLVLIFQIVFSFVIILVFSSVYLPARLYFIGKPIVSTVSVKAYTEGYWTREGYVDGYYDIATKDVPVSFRVDEEKGSELKIDGSVNVLYSDRLKYAAMMSGSEPKFLDCFVTDPQVGWTGLIMGSILFFTQLAIALLFTAMKIQEKIIEWSKKNEEKDKLKRLLMYIKEALTYTPLIATLYFLAFIFGIAAYKVETTGSFSAGAVVQASLLGIAYLPLGLLSFRSFLENNRIMQSIVLLIKVGAALFGSYKTLKFLLISDLTSFENIGEVAKSLWEFVIG